VGKAALVIGIVTVTVVGLSPWFQLRMLMFGPALAGLACGLCAWAFKPKERALSLEARAGLVLNALALLAVLVLAVLFSAFFADRFVTEPAERTKTVETEVSH